MTLKHAIATLALLLLCFASSVMAGPYEDAKAAHDKKDYATALRIARPPADQGVASCQNLLGVIYFNGQGVPQDYAQGLKWYRLAADQGLAKAQANLGSIYNQGQGVSKDYKEAAKWFRLAADQGLAEAQLNLGVMYNQGQGVPQDYATAVKWYRLAADQGLAHAQFSLGRMYSDGRGVEQNYFEAAKWFRLAVNQGEASAQNSLGGMYAKGHGVQQDYVSAHMWFSLSAAQGNKIAAKNRDTAAKRMTKEQIELAQDMSRKCKASNFKECDRAKVATAPTPNQNPPSANRPEAKIETKKSFGSGFFVSQNGHLITKQKLTFPKCLQNNTKNIFRQSLDSGPCGAG